MNITTKILFVLVLLPVLIKSVNIHHHDGTYINILSRSAIKVIEDVDSESFLTCISITTSNSRASFRQHNDIINNIAGGVANGMSIISSEDRNSTFHIERFKERKRFSILVVDGLNGFR